MAAGDEPTREMPEYAPGRAKSTEPLPTQRDVDDRPGPELVERTGPRIGRRIFWTLFVSGLVMALFVGVNAAGLLPGLRNPFVAEKTDRSQPPVLLSIRDLSRFVAAEGSYEVIIDLKEDRRFIPDWLINQRTLFVAAGTVEAYVDFSTLAQDKIIDSADHKTVEIKLPRPELASPKLNLERSYVFAEDRGLINRVSDFFDGDPNRQQETLLVAEQKIADASKASGLNVRAEENTRKALDGILHSLGYTNVTITFPPAA